MPWRRAGRRRRTRSASNSSIWDRSTPILSTSLQIVQNLIDQGVGAIGVSVLDASSIAPVVEAAKKKGVKLFTADSDAPQSGRAVYVAQATDQGLGETVIDELVKRVGPEGKIGIVSGEATASNLNAWIGFMQARAKAKYPKLMLLAAPICGRDRGACGSDRERPHGGQSRPQRHRRRGLHNLPRRCPGDRDRGQDRQGHRHGLLQSRIRRGAISRTEPSVSQCCGIRPSLATSRFGPVSSS